MVSYCERLAFLNLQSLQEHRLQSDLCLMFKILHGFVDVPSDHFFTHSTVSVTRGNSLKLCKTHCKLNATKNSFAHRLINFWNALPENIISASSVTIFKNRLKSFNLCPFCNFDRNL